MEELKKPLLDLFNDCFANRTLTTSQKTGVLTLLFKKGDPEKIENYRPIALLNVDLKILSKILTARLTKVMCHLVHPDQTGVKGRFIGTNTRLMFDILHLMKNKKLKGAVILLDQLKAFDPGRKK